MSDDTRPNDGTVIPFPGTYKPPETPPDQPPMHTLERGYLEGPCARGYHQAVVDARARRVQCRRCKADLDPFTVLEEVARHHEWYAHLIAEKAQLGKEIAALKDEVAKLRATRNRLRREEQK